MQTFCTWICNPAATVQFVSMQIQYLEVCFTAVRGPFKLQVEVPLIIYDDWSLPVWVKWEVSVWMDVMLLSVTLRFVLPSAASLLSAVLFPAAGHLPSESFCHQSPHFLPLLWMISRPVVRSHTSRPSQPCCYCCWCYCNQNLHNHVSPLHSFK